MTLYASDITQLVSKIPKLDATLDKDKDALSQYITKAETLLAKLPAKFKCNAQEKQLKEQIYQSCRKVRSQFITRHSEAVYSILTNNFTQYHRLSVLAIKAAEQFLGLVPTQAQIATEQGLIQANKEGLEIDQGIFFHGLLRSLKVGPHLADAMLLPSSRALALQNQLQDTNKIDLGTVLYERCQGTAHLTFNNQQHLNAEDNRFVDDMETAIDLVLLDERVNVGVLRGGIMTHPRYLGKRVFCSGINLKDLYAGKISFVDLFLTRELGYISKMMHGLLVNEQSYIQSIRSIQKPWIAAIDSFAIGGGMQVLLVCDKIIAAEDAYLSLPAAQEGIIPGAANYRLARVAGGRLNRQLILSGRKILANSTHAHYFCDQVVPTTAIDEAITLAAHELSQPAVVENRRMLNAAEDPRTSYLEYMAEFAYVQATRLYSTDVLAKIERFAIAIKKEEDIKEQYPCS